MKLTNTKKINQVKPLKKKIKTPKNVYFSNEKEKELDFEEDPFEEQSKSSRDIQEILIENNNDEKKIVNQEENNLLEKNEDIQSKTFESNISFRDDIRL